MKCKEAKEIYLSAAKRREEESKIRLTKQESRIGKYKYKIDKLIIQRAESGYTNLSWSGSFWDIKPIEKEIIATLVDLYKEEGFVSFPNSFNYSRDAKFQINSLCICWD